MRLRKSRFKIGDDAITLRAGGGVGPGLFFDFASGVYSEPITFTRSGTKWVRDSDGVYQSFGANALARTDLVGAVIEPAGAGAMLQNATFTSTAWTKDAGTTVASIGSVGPIAGQNAYRATVASGNGRLSQNTAAIVAGQVRRVTALFKVATAGWHFAYFRTDLGATLGALRNYVFDLNLGIAKFQGGGSSNITVLPVGNGYHLVTFDLTTGFTGAVHSFYFGVSNVELTSNTFVAPSGAGTFDVAFVDHVLGGKNESIVLATGTPAVRNADVVTLPLGVPSRDLVFTFDDDTTQTFADASGDFVIDPATLHRPRVKNADWGYL
jgi:hypothetical protein